VRYVVRASFRLRVQRLSLGLWSDLSFMVRGPGSGLDTFSVRVSFRHKV